MAEPTRLIEWTGERCVPWTDDLQVVYEHYHRYALAARHTAGRRVLDLASGEGYGAAMLAATAAEVVGIDIDEASVAHASGAYAAGNLTFEVGSITDPRAAAAHGRFDVITCFEAIEHVAEHDRLLELVASRLTADGLLLVSTPDTTVYSCDHGHENPFHVKELTEAELTELLRGAFRNVVVLRQTVAVGSLMTGGDAAPLTQTLDRRDDGWLIGDGVQHTYLVAYASNGDLPPVPSAAVLVDPAQTIVRAAVAGSAAEVERLHALYVDSRAEVDQLKAAYAAMEAAHVTQQQATAHAEARADDLDRRLERAGLDLDDARRRADELAAERDRLTAELTTARGELARAEVRLEWANDSVARLERTRAELAAENAELSATLASTAHRVVDRYRSVVERVAPRGTVHRNLYERAFGRPTGVLPAPSGPPAAAPVVTDAPEDRTPVAVATSEQPVVSVVIPVYGKWAYTRRCLASIEAASAGTPFEVIVVDDHSPDDTAELVERCRGVRLVRTPENLGFIGACNLGAASAQGSVLVFLNNDTEVRAGWLDAMLRTLEHGGDVGLVGARLVYPDGRLQECGGIVWRDGTGWNYGRGLDPEDPEFTVVRDVDYCSGAAIMIRRDLFTSFGGFDQRYAPAYYEDTDLAFAVRAAGLRTVVQPAAVVVHHEGVSNGTDVSAGVKRHQELNRATFVEKWSSALAAHRDGPEHGGVWLGRQRTASGHGGGIVLIVDHQVPMPDMDSGSVRMAAIIDQLLALGHRVLFFAANGGMPRRYVEPLQQRGVTVIGDPARRAAVLREVGPHLTLAILSRPAVAADVIGALREHAPSCVVAYDTVDLHFVRLGRQARVALEAGDPAAAAALEAEAATVRTQELGLVRDADLTFVVSGPEQDLLGTLLPDADVRVLSNIHAVSPTPASPVGREGILFVGSFDHLPNRDAADWMVTEIMPRVLAAVPSATLHIVGSNPTRAVLDLAGPAVTVHGWVESLAPLYATSRVAVAPLRFGAGVKGKVGESAGLGVPTVGTTLAFEGMDLRPGRDALVGDTPAELADAIVRLLTDDTLWTTISAGGKTAIATQFGPTAARTVLESVLRQERRVTSP
ncbi:MAG TPA: glycosyltransferase [Pseudonocardiaceae bacterium]